MTKLAPPPSLPLATWRALFDAATALAALKPWKTMYDCDVIGLTDPTTGETRIGCVLGNAGQVFGAVFYRHAAGLRWILSILDEPPEAPEGTSVDGIDCLKLEFLPKRELRPEDRAVIDAVGFKPAGRGNVWPQFRSAQPGWHPWHINASDAAQFRADLPRLTAYCRLRQDHPELGRDRPANEVPFLAQPLPARPLQAEDLDWRPMVLPPSADLVPFQAPEQDLARLRALPLAADRTCEFESAIMPGGSFVEDGRPCFGRVSLLVRASDGIVLGCDVASGVLPAGQAAGRSLIKTLLASGALPGELRIRGDRLQPVLGPLCAELNIRLAEANVLPALAEAEASLTRFMLRGP